MRTKYWLLLLFALLAATTAWGEEADDGLDSLRQRDDFVTASMLVTSPGEKLYSAYGHCVVRMECPTFDLDYCFSFESYTDETPSDYLRFFSGQTSAGFVAHETADYLKRCRDEGRGVTQWTLNLNPMQKQELWRRLDDNLVEGMSQLFDFSFHNCTSMSFTAVGSQLQGERLVVKAWPEVMCQSVRDMYADYSRTAQWLQLGLMTIMGTEVDDSKSMELYILPEVVGDVLRQSVFVSTDGTERPALLGEPMQLLPQIYVARPTWLSPVKTFLFLLVLVVVVTFGEWRFGWRRAARVLDAVLLTAQALAGIALLYFVLVSCIFGLHWNWCLIIFNPLPLLLWLLGRRHRWVSQLWLAYAVVLLLFAVVLPFFTNQILIAHQLFALALSVRCVSFVIKSGNTQYFLGKMI